MEQKRVSFKVAKAIKNAGYPQNTGKVYSLQTRGSIKEGDIINCAWVSINTASIPTYLDVWLWLWREKKFPIEVDCFNGEYWTSLIGGRKYNDPEEAIIAAIEYLVNNNLLK